MPTSDGICEFDIVVLPFPFSDRLAEKRRPAVVVSRTDYHWVRDHLILAMVTSSAHDSLPGDIALTDIATAGLARPSVVRTSKLATVERQRILRVAGKLDRGTALAVRSAIIAGLAQPGED